MSFVCHTVMRYLLFCFMLFVAISVVLCAFVFDIEGVFYICEIFQHNVVIVLKDSVEFTGL